MTERQKQMIDAYLPSPRDPDLEDDWYYVLDARDRPVKVRIFAIAFDREGNTIVQVCDKAGRFVHGPYETDSVSLGGSWYHEGSLYDNKPDCKSSLHSWYHDWEALRKLQMEEEENGLF